jgi:hypothetical protein
MRNLKPSYNGVLTKLVESKLKLAKTTSVKAGGLVMSKSYAVSRGLRRVRNYASFLMRLHLCLADMRFAVRFSSTNQVALRAYASY